MLHWRNRSPVKEGKWVYMLQVIRWIELAHFNNGGTRYFRYESVSLVMSVLNNSCDCRKTALGTCCNRGRSKVKYV